MKQSGNKAFTLTELLVVVVIIGVLSAVALPKFNRVIETRKTGEAEEILSAIRTEQEKRCSLDKPYAGTFKQIGDVLAFASGSGQSASDSYLYTLDKTGAAAQSLGKNYALSIPSYKDGRICCEGAYCENLNKNYPLCDDLLAGADYQASDAACAAESPETSCSGPAVQACGCKNAGTQSRVCDTAAGTWGAWGVCSVSELCTCAAAQPESSRSCGTDNCGTQTRSVTCNPADGTWSTGGWSTCDTSTCKKECVPTDKARCLATYYGPAGSWNEETCTCSCGSNVFDPSEGSCLCPSGKTWDGSRCLSQADKCEDADYAASHKCECEPTKYNCCLQDEVDGNGFVWNPDTRTCDCPAGMVADRPENGYWSCRCTNPGSNKALCCPTEPYDNGTCWKTAGTWQLIKEEKIRGDGWGQSDCNIPHNGSARVGSAYPTFTCEKNGETCTVIDDNHCDWSDEWIGRCDDTRKTTWKCKASYVKNGW